MQQPVETLRALRRNRFSWTGTDSAALNTALRTAPPPTRPSNCVPRSPWEPWAETGWKLLGADGTYTTMGYDPASHELFVDRTHSGNTDFSAQFPARTAAPLPFVPVRWT